MCVCVTHTHTRALVFVFLVCPDLRPRQEARRVVSTTEGAPDASGRPLALKQVVRVAGECLVAGVGHQSGGGSSGGRAVIALYWAVGLCCEAVADGLTGGRGGRREAQVLAGSCGERGIQRPDTTPVGATSHLRKEQTRRRLQLEN